MAFFRQNVPDFRKLWTKIVKKLGFFVRITDFLHFFHRNWQKACPCLDKTRLKLPKSIPLATLEVQKSIPLRAANPQVPSLWKNPPPPPSSVGLIGFSSSLSLSSRWRQRFQGAQGRCLGNFFGLKPWQRLFLWVDGLIVPYFWGAPEILDWITFLE